MSEEKKKEALSLIMEIGSKLSDTGFVWPPRLKRKFNKVTSSLS